LLDCLRLPNTNSEVIDQLIEAIYAQLTGIASPMCAASLDNRSLQPWQESIAKELLFCSSSNRLSIAKVAEACGMSTTQFSRAFKAHFCQTPQRWRLNAQIERAKTMMMGTSNSLTDIAVECGFAEQSHFNHTFRKCVGCCPSTWRRQHADAVPNILDGTPA